MFDMKRLVLVFALFFSIPNFALAEIGLELGLQDADRGLYIFLLNDSDRSHEVNRRFLIGSLERGADVELHVFDKVGHEAEARSFAEAAPLRPDDSAVLRPNQIVGRVIDKCLLADMFSLSPGKYAISVKYSPEIEWRPFASKAYIMAKGEISISAICEKPYGAAD